MLHRYYALNHPLTYTRENADGTLTVTPAAPDSEYSGDSDTPTETRTVITHHRFLYRGYLQIAALDLTRTTLNDLRLITWDPTETVATRPLAIQKDGTWYTYGLDLPKNITELYGFDGYIKATYTYTPYGLVTSTGNATQSPRGFGEGLDKPRGFAPQGRAANGVAASQPLQWSSEFTDTDLALVYYNYRHYNPLDGRWTGRDSVGEKGGLNLMEFCNNSPLISFDNLGKISKAHSICNGYQETPCKNPCGKKVEDPYIKEAKEICHKFIDMYKGGFMESNVSCVAKCLVELEKQNKQNDDCDQRNLNRLKNHVNCYTSCMFIPYNGFPEKGVEVGVTMLIPSVISVLQESHHKQFEYTGQAVRAKYMR